MKRTVIVPEFVEFVPEQLREGVLYISNRFNTAVHLCCCGCGHEVVTPLSPADWKLRRTGDTVTLHPSIGNWSFTCKSHYWIRGNRIVWAARFTDREIAHVRAQDRLDKARHIRQVNTQKDAATALNTLGTRPSVFARLIRVIASWIGQ